MSNSPTFLDLVDLTHCRTLVADFMRKQMSSGRMKYYARKFMSVIHSATETPDVNRPELKGSQ